MSNVKSRPSSRLLAVLLAVAMVFSMMPLSTVAYAATDEHPNAVTITVKGEDDQAIAGASVAITVVSATDEDTNISKTETTDENGVVEVLAGDAFVEDDLTLSATITKEGYESGSISNQAILSAGDNFDVTLKPTEVEVPGISVTATVQEYQTDEAGNSVCVDAAVVDGVVDGDVITYEMDGQDCGSVMPQISEAGSHSLKVTITRDGFEDYIATVYPEITKATITGINVTPVSRNYDKDKSDPIAEITGFEAGDTVTITYGENEYGVGELPTITNAGEYEFTVTVYRNDNYEVFSKDYTSNIEAVAIDGLSATLYSGGTYDGESHPAVTAVTRNGKNITEDEGYTIEYKLNNDDWGTAIPEVTDAGTYTVYVQVTIEDENYESPTSVVKLNPEKITIDKAEQSLGFKNYLKESGTITLKGKLPFSQEYDFSAVDNEKLAGGTISYSVELSDEGVAEIDAQTGLLKVYYPGAITVTATLSGNNNYKECAISYELTVTGETTSEGQYISFKTANLSYILGANSGVASQQAAEKSNKRIQGEISYSMESISENTATTGLTIDKKTGMITVANYTDLANEIRKAGGTLKIKVTADKGATDRFSADKATYTLSISFADTPENPYTIKGTKGNDGWYTSIVTLTPGVGYTIAKTNPTDFAAEVTFDDDGTGERYIYLQNQKTGEITNRIAVDIKIDTAAPTDLAVSYAKTPSDTFLEIITLGFYKPSVTIRFAASDEISGLDRVEWEYKREAGQSENNKENETGTVEFEKGVAEITIPGTDAAQYRGNITYTVYDKAGNSSSETDDGNVFVVDTIAPKMTIQYASQEPYEGAVQTVGTKHYFNSAVKVVLTIEEYNFDVADVSLAVTKDGNECDITDINPEWEHDGTDTHVCAFTLDTDADYVVSVFYEDKSGNSMEDYQSDTIVVDTTTPVIDFVYSNGNNTSADAANAQSATVKITEHNFRASDIVVEGTAQDITGADVSGLTVEDIQAYLRNEDHWAEDSNNQDVHTLILDSTGENKFLVDAIYALTINYKDLATNEAETTETGSFIVDHTAPDTSLAQVTYSTPVLEKVLSGITFGYYNPSVTITFTAYDQTSGVDHFDVSYTKQTGASESNLEAYVEELRDIKQNGNTFTASITLPKSESDQLRGNISFSATDKYSNQSATYTDEGKVVVVDTIAPTMAAKYTDASRTVGNQLYYNKNFTATFTITEANFYKEDVTIQMSKDGGAFADIQPVWTDESTDIHIATYTIAAASDHSNDGDYRFKVIYTDRSGNEMTEYTSPYTFTMDTIAPVVSVSYANTNPVNVLADSEGHNRQYFADTQTATVTVTEHNFNSSDVKFTILAKDVAGGSLNADSLSSQSVWTKNGDIYTMTITYPGDANYTFDVEYADLATNKAADYATDYFTVDKTAPTNLTVSYSTSIMDTVLESLTFGFYNAKMTVTITAEDSVSGVHSFQYSYVNASGVSSVNAQLLNQAIEAASIKYSNGGKTATTTFEIPKMVLGNDNQFNGTVQFTATDRANNKSQEHKESKRIIVDNIAPTANVTYSEATNVEGDIAYYNGDVVATVTINEANFYSQDVVVTVTQDGIATAVTPSWSNNSTDVHVGTFTLSGDGDYFITIDYKDKSSNAMTTYTSTQLTIDTEIQAPTVTINGEEKTEEGGAYKKDAEIAFNFADQNYQDYTVQLTKTRFDSVEDVTDEFIQVVSEEKGGSGIFSIPSTVENDGIYVLTVGMTDKADHTAETVVKFSINRYGSVYEYDDYLVSLIQDGGQYLKIEAGNDAAITDDLIITEYNADRLLAGSLNIMITRDGEAIDVDYTTNPDSINDQTSIGSSGWYQYVYTISASNFAEDGVYKITLSSAYAASDSSNNESTSVPENSLDSKGNQILDTINFTVDTVAPEIRNIVNLDQAIVNAQSLDVKYTIVDVGGLKSVEVILNGETIDTVTEFGDSTFNYTGQFTIDESSDKQTVQLRATDLAGNVTDTASEDFDTGDLYVFNKAITVSTNAFVRWYANKPLFWGSIGGVVVLAGGLYAFLVVMRKKKQMAK